MENLIAFCGICCNECEAYIATQNDDNAERTRIAESWSKQWKSEIRPEDINCDGCTAENGRHFHYCNVCEIRVCGQERELINCAYCTDYTCDKLDLVFKLVPKAKETLDGIHAAL
jgi:hypothetical protein